MDTGLHGSAITAMLLALALAATGIYDCYVALVHGPAFTVTYVIRTYSREYPMIPFLVGCLIGHLFWK